MMSSVALASSAALLALIIRRSGRGLRIGAIASVMLFILNLMVKGGVDSATLVSAVVPLSLAIINADKPTLTQLFKLLLIIGASPSIVRHFIVITSLLFSILFSIPYTVLGPTEVLASFTISFTIHSLILTAYLRIAKRI